VNGVKPLGTSAIVEAGGAWGSRMSCGVREWVAMS
jgi:hypothetical protein